MKKILFLLLIVFSFHVSYGQNSYLPLSDFKFHGLIAQYQDDTTTVFSLQCNGLENNTYGVDSLVSLWLTNHTDATVRPVCSFSYYRNAQRKTFTYCWIVSNMEKSNSLNAYLVRHGACKAKTMWWADKSIAMYPRSDRYNEKGVETKVFIDEATYRQFTQRIKRDEDIAYKSKLGIWLAK